MHTPQSLFLQVPNALIKSCFPGDPIRKSSDSHAFKIVALLLVPLVQVARVSKDWVESKNVGRERC